jgi:hypothetical protein
LNGLREQVCSYKAISNLRAALFVRRQRWQQLLINRLAHGREDGGAAGEQLLYQAPQGGGAGFGQAAHNSGAGLFGGGAGWHFEAQGPELAEQVFLVNQIRVHHFVCSLLFNMGRFWWRSRVSARPSVGNVRHAYEQVVFG